MGYTQAITVAWNDLAKYANAGPVEVKFMNDRYSVSLRERSVLSLSCNIPAKEHAAVIILHYLKIVLGPGGLPELTNEWIDFNQIEGGEEYYPAYKRRTIDVLARKYGGAGADSSFVLDVFEGVSLLIKLWSADEEFGPGANILFDKNIGKIFRTEDIVVMTEIAVHSIRKDGAL